MSRVSSRHRFVLPESPRWLLCKGRIAEVKEIVRKAAAFNNRPLPDNLDKLLKPPADDEDNVAGVCELFRSKYLRLVTFCFLCIWFTMNLVYYGLVLNMNSFGGNIYLNSVSISVAPKVRHYRWDLLGDIQSCHVGPIHH